MPFYRVGGRMMHVKVGGRIWAAYRPGQECGQADVSADYIAAAEAAQAWIRQHANGGAR
jgi:hypothetical protein